MSVPTLKKEMYGIPVSGIAVPLLLLRLLSGECEGDDTIRNESISSKPYSLVFFVIDLGEAMLSMST